MVKASIIIVLEVKNKNMRTTQYILVSGEDFF